MQWAIPNSGGAAVSEEVRVTAFCNNAIAGGVFDADKSGWWISDELGDGDSLIAMGNQCGVFIARVSSPVFASGRTRKKSDHTVHSTINHRQCSQ